MFHTETPYELSRSRVVLNLHQSCASQRVISSPSYRSHGAPKSWLRQMVAFNYRHRQWIQSLRWYGQACMCMSVHLWAMGDAYDPVEGRTDRERRKLKGKRTQRSSWGYITAVFTLGAGGSIRWPGLGSLMWLTSNTSCVRKTCQPPLFHLSSDTIYQQNSQKASFLETIIHSMIQSQSFI